MEFLPSAKSLLQRKLEAAKAIARYGFENFPIGSQSRMNIVDVHERVEEIIDGRYPPSKIPFEDETRYITPEDNPEIYEQLHMYFDQTRADFEADINRDCRGEES